MSKFEHAIPAILDRYGLAGQTIARPGGKVCHTFFTADAVVKIPRERFIPTARREAVAAQAALAAGIKAAPLIALDERGDLVERPFTVWRFLEGEHPGAASPVWREVGREVARLHDLVQGPGHLKTRVDLAPLAYLENPAVRTFLAGKAVWGDVTAWAQRLAASRSWSGPQWFLHGDVHALNVLTTPLGELIALLDWGDAGWGDPAYDLARAPCPAFPAVLEGYESVAGQVLGEHVRGRILGLRLARILRWASGTGEERGDLEALMAFTKSGPQAWRRYG
jgi:aminoglycoside phosphotransferase (APT) family kinase protein